MISGKDIVIVGQQAWDVEIGSNCKNIALELSKYNRVLYINSPLDRITKIRHGRDTKVVKRIEIIDGKKNGLEKVKSNLWTYYPDILIESINWIQIHKLFVFLNKRNNRLFAKSIQRPIRELGFTNWLLFNDSDIFRSFHLKEILQPTLSIYYSRDNMIVTDYWKRHGKILEPKLIRDSDLCVTNSEYLRQYCETYNSNSYYIGQGCDLEMFKHVDSKDIPSSLKQLRKPLIGYVGALTATRLDINLIQLIAERLPAWNIVLVGPEDSVFKKSELHSMKNVHFLGSKKPEELPKYINSFDVCINPQILNDFTIGNYPRKIDEYLALGKPVVATKTDTMLAFKDHVSLAESYTDFIDLIEKSFTENSTELERKRKQFAFSHSWENSVREMSLFTNKHLA